MPRIAGTKRHASGALRQNCWRTSPPPARHIAHRRGHCPPTGKTVCDARVSSHDQAEQLKTQAPRLEKHCRDTGFTDAEVVNDLGTSLNHHKKRLQRLLQDILDGCVVRLLLVTTDWLPSFGSELLFGICEFFHLEVVVLDVAPAVFREQLSAANYLRHRAARSGVPSCHPAAPGSVPDEPPLGSFRKKLRCPS